MNSPGAYIYILHGEDTFSRDEALRRLRERMKALPAGEHNLTTLANGDATLPELRAAADAMPFLTDRRMVVIHGLLGRLQGSGARARRGKKTTSPDNAVLAAEYDALLAYLPSAPSTTSIVFVEGKVDVAAVAKALPSGRDSLREFPRVEDVAAWIRHHGSVSQADLDESAVRELAILGGDDLRRLDNEIRKLAAYADGRTVTRADVRELVVARDVVIWALLDALVDRRRDAALLALRRLFAQGEGPDALIGRDIAPLYRRLLVAREVGSLSPRERGQVDLSPFGLNPRTLPRLIEQAARFTPAEIDRILDLLLQLDRALKSSETEPEAALEVAIIEMCARPAAHAA